MRVISERTPSSAPRSAVVSSRRVGAAAGSTRQNSRICSIVRSPLTAAAESWSLMSRLLKSLFVSGRRTSAGTAAAAISSSRISSDSSGNRATTLATKLGCVSLHVTTHAPERRGHGQEEVPARGGECDSRGQRT